MMNKIICNYMNEGLCNFGWDYHVLSIVDNLFVGVSIRSDWGHLCTFTCFLIENKCIIFIFLVKCYFNCVIEPTGAHL